MIGEGVAGGVAGAAGFGESWSVSTLGFGAVMTVPGAKWTTGGSARVAVTTTLGCAAAVAGAVSLLLAGTDSSVGRGGLVAVVARVGEPGGIGGVAARVK